MEAAADYKVSDYLELTKPWHDNPLTFLSRYYTLHYKKASLPQTADIYVRQTPSKVIVLGVTCPNIVNVIFNTDLIGKKVKPDSVLAELVDDQDQIFTVRAEMEGKLLELNSKLVDEPSLLGHYSGFIGLILPKIEDSSVLLKDFTSE